MVRLITFLSNSPTWRSTHTNRKVSVYAVHAHLAHLQALCTLKPVHKMASSSAFMSSRMSFAGSRVSVASAPRRGPMRARMTARSALEVGTASLQGTSRTQNEDRFAYKVRYIQRLKMQFEYFRIHYRVFTFELISYEAQNQ